MGSPQQQDAPSHSWRACMGVGHARMGAGGRASWAKRARVVGKEAAQPVGRLQASAGRWGACTTTCMRRAGGVLTHAGRGGERAAVVWWNALALPPALARPSPPFPPPAPATALVWL